MDKIIESSNSVDTQICADTLLNKKSTIRYTYIEYLRVLSCFAVVMIHVVYQSFLNFPELANENYIIIFNFLCFSVPNFVMITGALQLSKDKEFNLKKSIKKVIIPLMSFGYCFCLMELLFEYKNFTIKMLFEGIVNLVTGKSWAHLWYLYMLIGLYLIIPFIKICLEKINKRDLLKIIFVLLLFNSVLIDIEKIFNIDIAFYIPISEIFIFYLLVGYYVINYIKDIKNSWLLSSWIGLITVMLILGCNHIRLDSLKYNDIPTVWLSINVFLTFFKLKKYLKINRFVENISSLTFGIYIIHMIFVNFIYKFIGLNPYLYNEWIIWIFLSIFVFLCSAITTFVVRKIPIINKIFRV